MMDHLWIERARFATLSLFAFALFLLPAGLALALVLCWGLFFTWFLWHPGQGVLATWWRDPAVLFILALVLYAPTRSLMGLWLGEDARLNDWSAVGDWVQLAVILPFAVVLGGQVARLRSLLFLALIGLLLGMLVRLDWTRLLDDPVAWVLSREDFGFTAIAFGLYGSAALLGIVLLRWPSRSWVPWVRWGSGLLLVQGVLLTQSRGAWLALILALAIGLWLQWADGDLARPPAQAFGSRPALFHWVGGLVLVLLLGLNTGLVTDRLALEADSARALLQPGSQPDAQSSLGLRWNVQRFGLRLWLERPLFGWGAGASEPLIAAQAERAGLIDGNTPLVHLHNSYLELLVQLGWLGLVVFVALVGFLMQGVIKARRSGRLPPDLAHLLLALFVLLLVWNLFNFRMLSQDWRGFWTLVAGAALSVRLTSDASLSNGAENP